MKQIFAYSALLLSLSAFWSCSFSSTQNQYYVLTSSRQAEQSYDEKFKLIVGPVKLNQMIKRPEIITELSESKIGFAPHEKWASNIQDNMQIVVIDYLSDFFPKSFVIGNRNSFTDNTDYQLHVNFRHFNVLRRDLFDVYMNWQLVEYETGVLLAKGKFNKQAPLENNRTATIVSVSEKLLYEFILNMAPKIDEAISKNRTLSLEKE